MNLGLSDFKKGLKNILFPHVCEICGHQLPNGYSFVCESCLNERFEEAQVSTLESHSDLILPEGIEFVFSMWKFDKGGYLQDLLHNLKYHQLSGVGVDLGKQLGKELIQKSSLKKTDQLIVIPVPLHTKKERTRGFNQARMIGKGVKRASGWELLKKGAVTRIKNTKTQTGFTLTKRNENIQDAFHVANANEISGKDCVIIDDVYTTGATTFELAKTLKSEGAAKIIIATVACA